MLGGVLPKLSCKTLHLDLGNTEVAPWDLGKNMFFAEIRVRKFACGHGKQPYYYILLWFLPQWIRGPWFCDLRKIADLLAWGAPYPSQPQIRCITIFYFIFYLSTQPKKTYLNYDRIGSLVLSVTSTSRRVNEWRGKLSIPFLAWLANGRYVPRDTNPIRFFLCDKFH